MHRNLPALSNQRFDLLVIGGGMHGACVAWEATRQGLSVALVEQADFASGTSANSLKVIHGGLRYLQNADFRRMRQSIKSRQTLMRLAPHLVHPMPVLVPTYGHSIKGKEAMTIALKMNDLISCDRNFALPDPQKHIPSGQILSVADCLKHLPDLPTKGLTGAARFHDAQVYNSERLVLAFLQSAADQGALIANYARVIGFQTEAERVTGADVIDKLTGERFTIQARTIINAAGPWVGSLISDATDQQVSPSPLAKAMNLVTKRVLPEAGDCAVGVTSPLGRLFFIAPWRDTSLVGTWYGPADSTANGPVQPPEVKSDEVASFLSEVNQAYPSFNLTPADVRWVHVGLLPSKGSVSAKGDVNLSKSFTLSDHAQDGLRGLLSITGVKYTTAHDIAQKVLAWVWRDRQSSAPAVPDFTPLTGGQIDRFSEFLNTAQRTYRDILPPTAIQRLVYNYGYHYTDVLQYLQPTLSTCEGPVTDHAILAAEVRYNLKTSMPQTLSDIVFRRTELGSAGHPGDDAIALCANQMGTALGWNDQQRQREIDQVQTAFKARAPEAAVPCLAKN